MVRVRDGVGIGVGLGLGLGSGLHHALRHDALSTSVSNNFVHVRRIGIRRNGVEPKICLSIKFKMAGRWRLALSECYFQLL